VDSRRVTRTRTTPFVPAVPALPDDGDWEQVGVFVMDHWKLTDWFALTGGVRWSDVNSTGTNRATPAAPRPFDRTFIDWSAEGGVIVSLTDKLNWFGNVVQGFRAPNLDDLGSNDRTSVQGNDVGTVGLNEEEVTSYETGVKFLGPRLAGSATYYYADYNSIIVREPRPDGRNQRVNSVGYIQGGELEGAVLLTPNLSLFSTGSYQFGKDTQRNQPISRITPAFMTLGARWANQGPRASVFAEGWVEMMTKQNRLGGADRNDIRIPVGGTPAWQTFNFRTGIDTCNYGKVTLGFYNIFDQNYRIHGSGLDAPGFEVRLGYELTF
jgi:outer membrane receptor protein involved in Fe transport